MDAAALALPFLVALIVVALAFDFLNGMNDAANSIATIVSTRVLRPQYAVAWAAFFNFVAFLFFGLHVAETVGRGIVEADVVNSRVIFGALSGPSSGKSSRSGSASRRRVRTLSSAAWSVPASRKPASMPSCGRALSRPGRPLSFRPVWECCWLCS